MLKKFLLKIFSSLPFNNKRYLFNYTIRNNGAYIKNCKFIVQGKNNKIIFDDFCRMEDSTFYINGSNNIIHIGKKCRFLNSKFWLEQDNNKIILGENNKSSGKIIFAAMEGTSINLGKDNLLAYDIELRTSDGHSILDENNIRINNAKDIKIGNKNWICKNCVILKGTSINNENVVGYSSLLNKQFDENNCLFVGTPAKIIRQKINWRYEML